MQSLQKLKLVLKITILKTDYAGKLLNEAKHHLDIETKKLSDLEGYARDYSKMLVLKDSELLGFHYNNYQSFCIHLKNAIKKQQLQLQYVANEYEKRKELWRKCYNRQQLIEKYIDKKQQQLLQELTYKEQRELDNEITQMLTYNKSFKEL